MSNTVVIFVCAISITSLLTCAVQVDFLHNFTGDFGINGHDAINKTGYHVWIIAGANNYSLFQEYSSTINTIYAIALNFSHRYVTSCGEQYLYVYKQSFNASTLLAATFTGNDLMSGSLLIKSSVITVIYHYVGQLNDNAIGFNATYSIKPLFNYMEYRKCTGYYHHIAVYDETREKMLLHGGIDQQGMLCEGITKINTYNMSKEYVYWLEGPSGRYLHSGIFLNEDLIIYGGRNADEIFGELWKFNTNNEQWSELSGNAQMYGHSASLVGDCMIVIGGLNSTSVNSFVLQYNITNNTWYSLETYGETKPASIIGHTAVYDSHSNALLVYGGLLLIDMEFIESGSLYSLNMHSLQWSFLHVTSLNAINLIRIFPESVIINQTLYVFGGLVTNSHDCYSNDIMLFLLNSTCGRIPVLKIEGMFPRFGGRATAMRNGAVLLSGGYHSWAYDDIVKFVPPQDLCTMLTTLDDCLTVQWCQFCRFATSNISFCINSNRNDISHLCDTATVFLPPRCSITTPCSHSQTCGSCWSNDFQQRRDCHWCPCSQECVNSSSKCSEETCFLQHSNSLCYFSPCAVATCDDCARKDCVWTNQLEYVAGITVRIFRQPQQWQCFTFEIVDGILSQLPANFLFTSINQLEQCHPACSLFTSCSTCARALGDLVGPVGCTWIFETRKCMSHVEVLINCPTGSCGMVISDEHLCFDPCNSFSYCHSCLETTYCVWCHQNGSNGEGFCVSPEDTIECLNSNMIPINQECPAENECINGHSSCFLDQQCSDALNGFVCTCPSDYTTGETACIPICPGNCSNHGICVSPHTCHCDLGYTGKNCSVQCECNGHSNCVNDSVIGRSICIECLHNTQGKHCEMCKPFFIGSGENNCISCLEFCHGNSKICIDANLTSNKSQSLHLDLNNITINESGLQFNESICIHCQNNTSGRFCNECVSGYFYQKTAKSFQCIKCPCNGHSEICNVTTGLDCDCQNHTATLCPFDSSCIYFQCASCIEGYVGRPINGMQCYKKLDHNSQYVDNLPANQTSYYFIQPMYSDLDIQVFINIIKGSVDVFVSNSSQTFKIIVNSTTWGHHVERNSNLSGLQVTVMSYFNINERLKLDFSYEEYNLQNEQFYFVLLGKNRKTEFTIIFYQVALKLSWFSIISLFLCFFVIIFLSIIMVVYVKRQWNIHRNQRLYNYITNKRLSRPFSKMHVLLNHNMMFVQQENTNTTSMFCRMPSSKQPKQTISMVPLSVQPTSDTHSFINTVLIQLPHCNSSTSSRQINLTTGTYLNCNLNCNLNKSGTKLEAKITPL